MTLSAVYYVARCLIDDPDAPANAGIFRRLRVVTEPGSVVDEEWIMRLEREAFIGLLTHPKTQERIMGMMQTGKPVRN